MSHFSETLKFLRESTGYRVEYIAGFLRIAPSTYYAYEQSVREPSFEILAKIANLYDVSTDLLLGIEGKGKGDLNFKSLTDGLSKDQLANVEQYIEYLKWKSNGKRFE